MRFFSFFPHLPWQKFALATIAVLALGSARADFDPLPVPQAAKDALTAKFRGEGTDPAILDKLRPFTVQTYTGKGNDGKERKMPFILIGPTADGKPERGKKFPVILHLHGAGGYEMSGGAWPVLLRVVETPLFTYKEHAAKYPCWVFCPQHPMSDTQVGDDNAWFNGRADKPTTYLKLAVEALNSLVARSPSMDKDRVYLTGMCTGGVGAWEAMQKFPGIFAACAPFDRCGPAALLRPENTVPTWMFVSQDDGPEEYRRGFWRLWQTAGMDHRLTEYHENLKLGHFCWRAAYKDPALVDWMFAQRRGAKSPVDAVTNTPLMLSFALNDAVAGAAGAMVTEKVTGLHGACGEDLTSESIQGGQSRALRFSGKGGGVVLAADKAGSVMGRLGDSVTLSMNFRPDKMDADMPLFSGSRKGRKNWLLELTKDGGFRVTLGDGTEIEAPGVPAPAQVLYASKFKKAIGSTDKAALISQTALPDNILGPYVVEVDQNMIKSFNCNEKQIRKRNAHF